MTENTYFEGGVSARRLRRRDEAALRILQNELTPRQRQVLFDYYLGNQNVSALARKYGVAPSTVWRTLRRAEVRLHRFLQYQPDAHPPRSGGCSAADAGADKTYRQ